MKLVRGSREYYLSTLTTVERMLKEIKADIQSSDGDVPSSAVDKVTKKERPSTMVYNKGTQYKIDSKDLMKASSLEFLATKTDRGFRSRADVGQSEKGVNITTKEPNQTEKGVPAISPEVKTEEPSVEVYNENKELVDKDDLVTPGKIWEELARKTDQSLSGVSNGQEIEHPEIHDKTTELVK